MTVHAHPRFLRRRTNVREHRARRHVRRALGILFLVAAVWAVVWVAQSPLFSVTSIQIAGVERAGVDAVLEAQDVYPGRPLVLIRTGTVEAALRSDPWIREASVNRRFPDRVEIDIEERVEVAVVPVADGWKTLSDDGHIMASVAEPPAGLALVGPGIGLAGPGGEAVSATMMGVVEFVAALPRDIAAITTIRAAGDELMAEIGAHQIRLGDPTNMAAKAAALGALLDDPRLAPDAVIDLIAPTRPAVSSPVEPAAPTP
jgi:cell division protein FtsQ